MLERPSCARTLGMVAALVALGAGCSDGRCRDVDEDGYGKRCALGPDCDDTNQGRNVDCDAVPAPDCDADPSATGCPCFLGAFVSCYEGAEETLGVGVCEGGTRFCVNGHFGVCRNQTVPSEDACNELDDDCDARTDEHVRSPCGGCNAACAGDVWGGDERPFVTGAGLVLTDEPALELARTTTSLPPAVWLANSAEDTVSRIDPVGVAEVARHASGGDDPSRVAVDFRGDLLVTNRALEGQSTLTKIASELARCVDRDASTSIRTSTGPTDVPPLLEDECVLWSVDVGAPLSVARALAIDGSTDAMGDDGGDAWVGLHRSREILHLDGRDGAELDRIALPIEPFFAAFDPRGVLWVISQDGYLAAMDRRTSPPTFEVLPVPLPCYSLYGMAVDERGDLLLTGYACNQVVRFRPRTRTFSSLATLPNPRSAVFLGSEAWVTHTDGRLSELELSPFRVLRTVDLHALGEAPLDTIGVGVDALGKLWTVSAIGGDAGRGLATRVDPVTGSVTHHLEVGLAPHVMGDLTGVARGSVFVPTGATSAVFTGCADVPTDWRAVYLEADVGAVGTVTIEARWGATSALREAAEFVPLGAFPTTSAPFVLPAPDGTELELRLTLATSARDGTPSVRSVGVEYSCVSSGLD